MKTRYYASKPLPYQLSFKLSLLGLVAFALLPEAHAAVPEELHRELVKVTNEITDDADRGTPIPPETMMAACSVLKRLADDPEFRAGLKQVANDNAKHRTQLKEMKGDIKRFTDQFLNPEERALKSYGFNDSVIKRLDEQASSLREKLDSGTSEEALFSSVQRFRDAVCDVATQARQISDAAQQAKRDGATRDGLIGIGLLLVDIPAFLIPGVGPAVSVGSMTVGGVLITISLEELKKTEH